MSRPIRFGALATKRTLKPLEPLLLRPHMDSIVGTNLGGHRAAFANDLPMHEGLLKVMHWRTARTGLTLRSKSRTSGDVTSHIFRGRLVLVLVDFFQKKSGNRPAVQAEKKMQTFPGRRVAQERRRRRKRRRKTRRRRSDSNGKLILIAKSYAEAKKEQKLKEEEKRKKKKSDGEPEEKYHTASCAV
ncbi:hypothetical protein Tco_0951147 [Tanacetum coccineum]|uniref:Uncharacterized protein n=1 Tax=Tanacetum coccineum TaxID=301880 RepID=A0ABQ5DTA5_9ASTR